MPGKVRDGMTTFREYRQALAEGRSPRYDERWRDRDFGMTLVDRATLFQSELKPTGAVYSQLKVFKLNDQPIE